MRKELFLTSLCSLAVSGVIHADTTNSDLYLFLGGTSSATSVSTSMHDAGSAAASYTLGGGNNGVETTTGHSTSSGGGGNSAAYEEAKYDTPSSSGSSSAPTRRRRASSGSSSSSATAYTPSDSPKGGLAKGGIIPAAYNPSPLIITAEAGYQSQYVYSGVNRIRLSVYDPNTGGFGASTDDFDMYYLGTSVKWKGLSFGLKYIRSLDSDLNPLFYPTTTRDTSYTEYVADLNYTLGLIAGPQGAGNWLDATVGYEFTYFPEETFWNTDSQSKLYASLKVNRYKWARPSVTYQSIDAGSALTSGTIFAGFDMLSGEQLIFQVDGGDTVFSAGNVQVGVGYYVSAGHGSGYTKLLGDELNGDWYQAGLNIPISFGDFTVTPSVHYTENDAKIVKEPGFWWGINAKYTF